MLRGGDNLEASEPDKGGVLDEGGKKEGSNNCGNAKDDDAVVVHRANRVGSHG